MQMLRYLLIFSSISLAAFGQIILKVGMAKNGEISLAFGPLLQALSTPFVLGGLFFYGASLLIWLVVLSREDLSFVYPMVAFSYLLTTILAKLVLKENIPTLRWFGLSLILMGIIFVARSSKI